MIGRIGLATVVIPLLLAILLLVVLLWAKQRIIAGSILLGALLGGVVGFWVGVALGPGPETGAMYGINQLASGTASGFWGLLIGAILGGASGWAFSAWWRRERRRTLSFPTERAVAEHLTTLPPLGSPGAKPHPPGLPPSRAVPVGMRRGDEPGG